MIAAKGNPAKGFPPHPNAKDKKPVKVAKKKVEPQD